MNHQYIRVIPRFTSELKTRRRHRCFVVINGRAIQEPNSTSVEGAYDVQLKPGNNEVSVEVLADLRDGERKEYAPPQLQFDFEKSSMIINLGLIN